MGKTGGKVEKLGVLVGFQRDVREFLALFLARFGNAIRLCFAVRQVPQRIPTAHCFCLTGLPAARCGKTF